MIAKCEVEQRVEHPGKEQDVVAVSALLKTTQFAVKYEALDASPIAGAPFGTHTAGSVALSS